MFKYPFELNYNFGCWLEFFGLAKRCKSAGRFRIELIKETDEIIDMGDYTRKYHFFHYKLVDYYDEDTMCLKRVIPIKSKDVFVSFCDWKE